MAESAYSWPAAALTWLQWSSPTGNWNISCDDDDDEEVVDDAEDDDDVDDIVEDGDPHGPQDELDDEVLSKLS